MAVHLINVVAAMEIRGKTLGDREQYDLPDGKAEARMFMTSVEPEVKVATATDENILRQSLKAMMRQFELQSTKKVTRKLNERCKQRALAGRDSAESVTQIRFSDLPENFREHLRFESKQQLCILHEWFTACLRASIEERVRMDFPSAKFQFEMIEPEKWSMCARRVMGALDASDVLKCTILVALDKSFEHQVDVYWYDQNRKTPLNCDGPSQTLMDACKRLGRLHAGAVLDPSYHICQPRPYVQPDTGHADELGPVLSTVVNSRGAEVEPDAGLADEAANTQSPISRASSIGVQDVQSEKPLPRALEDIALLTKQWPSRSPSDYSPCARSRAGTPSADRPSTKCVAKELGS